MVDFVCFLLGCDMVLVTTIVIVLCSMHGRAICPFLGGGGGGVEVCRISLY